MHVSFIVELDYRTLSKSCCIGMTVESMILVLLLIKTSRLERNGSIILFSILDMYFIIMTSQGV